MADYTTITDAQVDPEAPITSELMSALRDNPIAIAEAAASAPKIDPRAMDNILAGPVSGSRVGNGTTVIATVTNLDDAEVIFVTGIFGVTVSDPFNAHQTYFEVQISSNNGSSWFQTFTLGSVSSSSSTSRATAGVIPMGGFNAIRIQIRATTPSNGATHFLNNAYITAGSF